MTEDVINRPSHYHKHAVLVEPIELCELLGFNLGNCLKYCFRYQDKGNPLQDMKKAQFYIRRILAEDDDQIIFRAYDGGNLLKKRTKVYMDIFRHNEFVLALATEGYMGLSKLIDEKIAELEPKND